MKTRKVWAFILNFASKSGFVVAVSSPSHVGGRMPEVLTIAVPVSPYS